MGKRALTVLTLALVWSGLLPGSIDYFGVRAEQATAPKAVPKTINPPKVAGIKAMAPKPTSQGQAQEQPKSPATRHPAAPPTAKPASKPTSKTPAPATQAPKPNAASPGSVLPSKPDPYHLKLPTSSPRLTTLKQRLDAQKQLSLAQKNRLLTLQAALAALSTQQKSALAELDALAAQIAQGRNRQQELSSQVAQAQAELDETSAQLDIMAGQVTRLESDVRQMLQAVYRQRSGQYLEVLNQASSLSDLMIRARYTNIGGQHNVAVVEQLRLQRQDLQGQQQKQKAQAAKLLSLQQEQKAQLARLSTALARQRALIASLRQTQAGKQALALQTQQQQAMTAQNINDTIGKLIGERNNIELERRRRIEAERVRRAEELRRIREAQERARKEAERLAALRRAQAIAAAKAAAAAKARAQAQAQAAARARARALAEARRQRAQAIANERAQLQARQQRLEAQQRQSAAALAPLPPASGPLGFPVPGGTITQAFSESSPWTVVQASSGAQAVAALSGNVLAVTNYASLGWVVLIDHGNLVTAYLGLSDTRVTAGQHVATGAALGSIGGSPIFGEGHMAFQVNRVSGGGRVPVPPNF